jgi:phosphinothricin acetyltransferase
MRPATLADAEAIAEIYNYEVENTTATFDLVPRSVADQRQWLADRSGAFACVVAEVGGEVVGFGALSPYKERAAYRTTVEDSVYVRRDCARRGIGRTMLDHLLETAETGGFHSVMARITSTGDASIALHLALGFTVVGVEREVGRKFGKWLDVTLMQCLLHERSHT